MDFRAASTPELVDRSHPVSRARPPSESAFRKYPRRPDDHRDERVRENGNQDDVHDYESNDEEHDRKMNVSRDRIPAKKTHQRAKLHGLPDRQAGYDLQKKRADHAEVQQALNCVVVTDPMPEPKGQRGPEIFGHGTRCGDPEISSEMPGYKPVSEIRRSSQCEQPHGAEMPGESSPQPTP